MSSAPRHFLQFGDFSLEEFDYLVERTRWIKERFKRYELYQPLRDRTLAMVFEKASTRTRVSFEAGMNQLGGIAINLNRSDTQLARGEPIEDLARVISRMVDVVMIRTVEQAIIERFAAHSRVPVINGLTNEYHPCQILADLITYSEHRGPIRGKTVAWIGDSNNVCNTWLQAAAILDFHVRVSTPPGYEVASEGHHAPDRSRFDAFADPMDACRGADLVTTDVWTSMGFEAENESRKRDLRAGGRRADDAPGEPDALFMRAFRAPRRSRRQVIDGRKLWCGTRRRSPARAEGFAGVSFAA
jgi:ornithine carbamoyltransferase